MAKSNTTKVDLSNVALEILAPDVKEYSWTLPQKALGHPRHHYGCGSPPATLVVPPLTHTPGARDTGVP